MRIEIANEIEPNEDYRDVRVRSLYNVDGGQDARFEATWDLPIEDDDWQVGLVVGPSGSGKSSIGHELAKQGWELRGEGEDWPHDRSVISSIDPDGSMDRVAASLTAVGLGTVPAWLRPWRVLSNGEKWRANLARLVVEEPERVVVDEFTSVVDRQIAQIGSMAFAKAWRRTGGQVVLLTCHYDVIEWLQPDWVLDTATGEVLPRGSLQLATHDPVGDRRGRVGVLEA